MTTTINASPTNGLVQTADGSGVLKVQSNGVTTNALAWVNFNGTTSPGTIRSSYNVGSVTKGGTGLYTVNFAAALSDANYSTVLTGIALVSTNNSQGTPQLRNGSTPSTSSVSIQVGAHDSNNLLDSSNVNVAVFGN